jgi:hypothetical protein
MASTIYDLNSPYAKPDQTSFYGTVNNLFQGVRQWVGALADHHIIPKSFLTGSQVDRDVQARMSAAICGFTPR